MRDLAGLLQTQWLDLQSGAQEGKGGRGKGRRGHHITATNHLHTIVYRILGVSNANSSYRQIVVAVTSNSLYITVL